MEISLEIKNSPCKLIFYFGVVVCLSCWSKIIIDSIFKKNSHSSYGPSKVHEPIKNFEQQLITSLIHSLKIIFTETKTTMYCSRLLGAPLTSKIKMKMTRLSHYINLLQFQLCTHIPHIARISRKILMNWGLSYLGFKVIDMTCTVLNRKKEEHSLFGDFDPIAELLNTDGIKAST